jgi:hypothetical protein
MCSASYALKKQSRRTVTETDDVLAYSVRLLIEAFQPEFDNHIKPINTAYAPANEFSISYHKCGRSGFAPPGLTQSITICCNYWTSPQGNSNFFSFALAPAIVTHENIHSSLDWHFANMKLKRY